MTRLLLTLLLLAASGLQAQNPGDHRVWNGARWVDKKAFDSLQNVATTGYHIYKPGTANRLGSLFAGTNITMTQHDSGIVINSAGGGGGGETNTASNLGGGLANFDSKSGVDLRFNTFDPTYFNLSANLLTLDNAAVDHGLLTGLSDDDHTQYGLLAGRSGGQTLRGGTGSGDDLSLYSTSHGTKGNIFFGASGNHTFDEVNGRWGLGRATPLFTADVLGTARLELGQSVLRIERDQLDATNAQELRLGLRHWTLAEEPVGIVHAQNTSGANTIYWGGGLTSLTNAATVQEWYIGATTTTQSSSSTRMMRLNSVGLDIGGANHNALLRLEGTHALDQMVFLNATSTSTTTGTQRGYYGEPGFNPGGASLTNAIATQMVVNILGSSITIGNVMGYLSRIDLESGFSGTVTLGVNYRASEATVLGGSLTTLVGFQADALTAGATNNWGFRGSLSASGTSRWNLYMDGTAPNYLEGNLSLGSATVPASATQSLSIFNGTAPSASVTDGVILYSADRGGTAGKAGLHVRAEDATPHVLSDRVGLGTTTPDSFTTIAGAVNILTNARIQDNATVENNATVGDDIIQDDVVRPYITVGGDEDDRTFTVSIEKFNNTAGANSRFYVHWWTSTSSYGTSSMVGGGQTVAVTTGTNEDAVSTSTVNHAFTDANGDLVVAVSNSQTTAAATVYFHIEVQGIIYQASGTVFTGLF